MRALGHQMVDDMVDYLASAGDGPVWQKMPADLKLELQEPLPREPKSAALVYEDFQRLVRPYALGNINPRFMGWVHGGGNPIGMLAELLAGGLNANLGGRDHAPIEVERQVIRWSAEMIGFPSTASGLLVTGTSQANFIGLLVARTAALGVDVRKEGLGGRRLVAYASTATHGSVKRAMEMSGLGSAALHMVPCDDKYGIDLEALSQKVNQDRQDGFVPFLVFGTAGTVDTGAIDNLRALADFCRRQQVWFHVDAAFGALALLSPTLRPLFDGISEADSVGFDFHKWAQIPYDCGCVLVRDAAVHMATFSFPAHYLRREERGLAAGHPWPCDFGPELSRGFRALKVWMTLKTYGADRLAQVVEHSCALAKELANRVDSEPELERLAPVSLNIVCFRYRYSGSDVDLLNANIVADLQELGIAAPSTTTIGGHLAIRAALVNHRTLSSDVHAVVDAVISRGRYYANLGITDGEKMAPERHLGGSL